MKAIAQLIADMEQRSLLLDRNAVNHRHLGDVTKAEHLRQRKAELDEWLVELRAICSGVR